MTSRPRSGTMVNGSPVEMVWMGSEGSMSPSRRLVARTTVSRSCAGPNLGSAWVISPKTGCPDFSSKRTGTLPTLSSRATSRVPVEPRNWKAVPSVGWPAKGNSSCTVKIRTRTPRSRSLAASRGKMNVVSERFISRAMACICESSSPRASGYTARELPSKGREEKTSNCTKGKRRRSLLMAIYCTARGRR